MMAIVFKLLESPVKHEQVEPHKTDRRQSNQCEFNWLLLRFVRAELVVLKEIRPLR
jgi:hypothetical protein